MPTKRPRFSVDRWRRGTPSVEPKLPNETTRAAMLEALEGKDLTEWPDLEKLKAAHD